MQIWDPDFESKFGGSLSSRSGGNSNNNSQLVDSGGRDTVNVLLCIDSGGMKVADDELGGWAPQGLIVPGLNITGVCALGNVLTSIRECQALMSLRSLSKSLQEVVLCGGSKGMQFSTAYATKGDVGGILPDGIAAGTAPSASNTLKDSDRLSCPETLPTALWKALSGQYNSSQLRAIHAVCLTTTTVPSASDANKPPNPPTSGSSATATVTLLQGPPGTGKTRTVLAIVAALLAGGGSAQRRTGSKVLTSYDFFLNHASNVRLMLQQRFLHILSVNTPASESNSKVLPDCVLPLSSSLRLQVIAGASLRNPAAATCSSTSHAPPTSAKKIRVLVCAPSNTAVDEVRIRHFSSPISSFYRGL